jgi:hypothetical protein
MKAAAAPCSRLVCQSVSRLMKGSCLPSIVRSAVGRIVKSTFAGHLNPGNNGIGDSGAIVGLVG